MQKWLEHQIIKSIAPNTQPKPGERGRRKGGEQKQAVHIQPGVSPQPPPPPQTLSQGRRKGDRRQAGEGRGRGGGGRFNASGKGEQIESKHTSRQLGRLGLGGGVRRFYFYSWVVGRRLPRDKTVGMG